jgi:cytochrome d ubiquinol oxidase subunit I
MTFDSLSLSRLQFGVTALFHILWPILTISLSAFVLAMEAWWVHSNDLSYYRQARFWGKLLVLNFAVGVVSGIPLEFQFGTNWSSFSEFTGQFIGNILGFEGAMAFMLEAGFIGIMTLGWDRVPRGVHLFATAMVALGSSISAFWIMVANSWMQTPAGIQVVGGKVVVVDYVAAIFNPAMATGVAHMWLAAMETGLVVVGGISAWYLFRRQHTEFFLQSFKGAVGALLVIAPLQVMLGDASGVEVFEQQPAKGAAIEGHWQTNAPGTGADWSLLAWPNQATQSNDWSLEVPGMLSLLGTHSLHGTVVGLRDIPRQDQPPALPLLYYAFRVMAGVGFLLVAIVTLTAWMLYRTGGRLSEVLGRRKLLLAWIFAIPLPYIAVEAGWIVREVGRQPWVVYGLLRTSDAASPVPAENIIGSLGMFIIFYAVLMATFAVFALKWLRKGPDMTISPQVVLVSKENAVEPQEVL